MNCQRNNINSLGFEVCEPIRFDQVMPPKIYDSNCIEFWMPINPNYIPNLGNRYWVSNFGRVMDMKYLVNSTDGKIIHGSYDSKKYLKVTITDIYGKPYTRKIHRLVMMTFYYFPGCENYEVNHLDGNHENNNTCNLEWATGSQNRIHAIMNGIESTMFGKQIAILTEEQVWSIRALKLQGNYNNNQIIDKLGLRNVTGLNRRTIEDIQYEKNKLYRNNWYFDNN